MSSAKTSSTEDAKAGPQPAPGSMPQQKVQPVQPIQPTQTRATPRPLDNSGAPPEVSAGDTESMDERALSLGVDSAGGFAVPYQLDGTKPKRPVSRD